ncbi:COG4223 family protein [Mesobacterium pallidum]|uniref:COG4223 family protein n=1 Tax=Mesobacterium pallidum TaxID=2872037 RepID=UPI001EE23809|nr:hypothetical protein [Mesobacterium pallidum]
MAESDRKDAEAAKDQTEDSLEAAAEEGTEAEETSAATDEGADTVAADEADWDDLPADEPAEGTDAAVEEEPAEFEGTIIDPEVEGPEGFAAGPGEEPAETYSENEHVDAPAEEETLLEEPTDEPDALEDTGPSQVDATPDSAGIGTMAAAGAAGAAAQPAPAPETVRVVERKGGAGAMVLGGVIAAALGFGAAQYSNGGWPFSTPDYDPPEYVTRDALDASLSAQSTRIDELAAASEAGLTGDQLDSAVSALRDELTGRLDALDGLTGEIDALAARITELERAPIENNVSDAAIAAYEEELRRLQESVAAQRAEMETMASEAAQMEANATETARETMARSAVTRIQSALDSGTPFGPALADLAETGTQVPEVLDRAATEGVPPQSVLEDTFPDAARDALSAAREETGDGGSIGNFLKRQLGARSVAPRDGDDPDAVLSRVEAAVQQGRLADALAEIETLPEPAQAALGDWVAAATLRRDALDAAEGLAQGLNE